MKKSLILALSLIASGCITYKIPTEQLAIERNANEMQMKCKCDALETKFMILYL